ncbi:MAG TPA: hemolysin III family protein [Saprospiraceae bacterium]|nr:hemolysin III family protein [Saprospiraceae bacterium]MCB9269825.1 hemolysin III family protein [Lewinellaceae bacterium]HPG08959.1 hemolysin III family protein [Saprospiraceae bacterium]HPQ99354.1 hemolysin III family protein [Saprospiraceae bacterium]HQU51987.1 hemolysin III family protein [Saprospiraceae bacterium]
MASDKEEQLNAYTHGLGLLFGLVALPLLLIQAYQNAAMDLFMAILIYSICFTLLYLASTLYHGIRHPRLKEIFQTVDHISIYFKIAGTYTPFIMGYLYGQEKMVFMMVIWSIVLVGTLFKLRYTGRFEKLSVALYLFMGWLVIFRAPTFYERMPLSIILFIILGGLAFTIGVYFYRRDDRRYYHAIWHVFTLAGSILHYIAVFLIIHSWS